MARIGIVRSELYSRLGPPWPLGVALLLVVSVAAFFVLPDALLLLAGIGVPLGGGALFGYLGRSFWWAVVAVVAGWLGYAVFITSSEGWDVGPVEDVAATALFAVYLAGATILGGLLGKGLATARA